MAVVRMPEVLANSGEATIQSWLVSIGQVISVGDPIAEIETEKAVVEYAAEVEGVLTRLLADPGATIPVGEAIAVVLAPGETDDDVEPVSAEPTTAAPVVADGLPAPALRSPEDRRIFATPLVRKLARQQGIDLHAVRGTGPAGRIVRRDIERVPVPEETISKPGTPVAGPDSEAVAHAGGFTDISLSGMRRIIARRLTESKTTVPHFYVTADCRVDALLELRDRVNAEMSEKVSLNDFIVKAVGGTLLEVPESNAIWNGDTIRAFTGADIAVAVAVEGGLVTPVLRGVDTLPLSAVSARITELAQRARAGRIRQDELEGGSFTVSNLGMYGLTEFSAILNPPHSGILAVGKATQRPMVSDGQLAVGTVMTVTLSADHRVIDGAVAAQWIAAFTRRIEHPMTILI